MKGLKTILFLAVFLLFSTYGWTEWYPGITHVHSTFSDGDRNPKQVVDWARLSGARFLIVTDHYEQINGLYQFDGKTRKRGSIGADEQGFDNYRSRFLELAHPDFVIIPGAEITTYWATSSRDPAASHTLALGDLAFRDEELFKLDGEENTQQKVTNRLNEMGLLPIAAHPSLVLPYAPRWEWAAISNYQFDPMGVKGIKGFEFFNDYKEDGYKRTLDWYLRLLRQGNDVFVTSGCDSHESNDPGDSKRWKRKTWVFSEKLEAKSLLEAMAQGRTYAANDGASFGYLNHILGFQTPEQEVDRAKFVFWVKFEPETSGPKTARIYRDGNLVPESVQTLPIYPEGMTGLEKEMFKFDRIDYLWEDKGVETGEHLYVIEVEGYLITSPIRLKIRAQSLPIDWKEYEISALSYSVPADWKVGPEAKGGVSRMYYTDRGHTTFMVGVIDTFKEVEQGKWRIVHYGMSGGKKIEELGTTSRTISIGHMGRLVDSFKTEVAGYPVTVCVLRLTEKEGVPVEGMEFVNWSFALIKAGKHYALTLTSADPAFQKEIFKQFVSRIHFLPKTE